MVAGGYLSKWTIRWDDVGENKADDGVNGAWGGELDGDHTSLHVSSSLSTETELNEPGLGSSPSRDSPTVGATKEGAQLAHSLELEENRRRQVQGQFLTQPRQYVQRKQRIDAQGREGCIRLEVGWRAAYFFADDSCDLGEAVALALRFADWFHQGLNREAGLTDCRLHSDADWLLGSSGEQTVENLFRHSLELGHMLR